VEQIQNFSDFNCLRRAPRKRLSSTAAGVLRSASRRNYDIDKHWREQHLSSNYRIERYFRASFTKAMYALFSKL